MIKVSSPTRIDLAGGTLDCWPLYLLFENCVTINLAIDIMTHIELEPLSDNCIEIEVKNFNYTKNFESLQSLLESSDPALDLFKPHIKYWQPQQGFRLSSTSESPVGGGLGGSSSLCISLLKAFELWLERPLSVYDRVNMAHNIEAQILKKPTGTQDYFPPSLGGLNLIHYGVEGPRIESLEDSFANVSENIMVIYTGKAHHSGINNWDVIKKSMEGDSATLAQLEKIAQIAQDMVSSCRKKNWGQIPELFRAEFNARVRLSPSFTSPEIESLQKLVLQEGAEAVKICGAGGGGCIVLWATPERHEGIRAVCLKNGFQPLDAKPVGPLAKKS